MQEATNGLQVSFGKTRHKQGCPHAGLPALSTTLSPEHLPDAGGSKLICNGRLTLHVG